MSEPTSSSTHGRLVFACSGAADVGEIADRVARLLHREGTARMFCLACVGALMEDAIARARTASDILAIDGCESDCARKCLESAGVPRVRHLRLTDHQMPKGQTPPNLHNVQAAAERAKHVLLVP